VKKVMNLRVVKPMGIKLAQAETLLKPGIDCALLPREAMFVALPRKVGTMLPRAAEGTLPLANLARVEPNRSGSLSRGKGISVCCALSVDAVLWRCGTEEQRRSTAAHGCRASMLDTNTVIKHKQTNEFAAHEQLRAAAARSRYPA
jgi:hypothetical protein